MRKSRFLHIPFRWTPAPLVRPFRNTFQPVDAWLSENAKRRNGLAAVKSCFGESMKSIRCQRHLAKTRLFACGDALYFLTRELQTLGSADMKTSKTMLTK
jgi:hypothetical protein